MNGLLRCRKKRQSQKYELNDFLKLTKLLSPRHHGEVKYMKKIEIIDCENFEHKISLIIAENCVDFADDVYHALSDKTLPKGQAKKLHDFRVSCSGPIMVPNYHYDSNLADIIEAKGLIYVYGTGKYIHIEIGTNIQGRNPQAYRTPISDYKGLIEILDDIHRMSFYGGDKLDTLERIWVGRKVY